MQNRRIEKVKMLAAAVLSSALLCSCAASRAEKSKANEELQPKQDSVDTFVPTHPPVVVNKTWREVMEESQSQSQQK